MKTSKTYYHAGLFKYLPGDKWPEQPVKPESFQTKGGLKVEMGGDFGYEKALAKYNQALTSALKEAIDFEDQEKIESFIIGPNVAANNFVLKEGLYSIPDVEVDKVPNIYSDERSLLTPWLARLKESNN